MMNIALTDDLQRLLRKKVENGQFPNEEAVIEQALSLFLTEEPPTTDRPRLALRPGPRSRTMRRLDYGVVSTLRSAGYPRPTQDSLPAVGQTLLDGLFTRRVMMKGFRALATSHPPLPSLPGAIGSTEASNADFRSSCCNRRFCSVVETLA